MSVLDDGPSPARTREDPPLETGRGVPERLGSSAEPVAPAPPAEDPLTLLLREMPPLPDQLPDESEVAFHVRTLRVVCARVDLIRSRFGQVKGALEEGALDPATQRRYEGFVKYAEEINFDPVRDLVCVVI